MVLVVIYYIAKTTCAMHW